MTEKTDTPNKEPKTSEDFTKMPSPEDFADLEPKLQESLLVKFKDVEDTPKEESTLSPEEIAEKKALKDKEDASKETEKETLEKTHDWEKRYKDLQKAYTKETEKNKILKTPSDKRSRFDGLRDGNPKAKDFLTSLEKAIEEKMGESVKPLSDRLDGNVAKENQEKLLADVDAFLEGELKEMKPELEAIIVDRIGDQEALMTAAGENPNLFNDLKKELLDQHLDKVIEIKTRAKGDKTRNQEVKDLGVSGKSKTGADSVDEDLDIKSLRGLDNYQDMKKALNKQGAVDVTAKSRGWDSKSKN